MGNAIEGHPTARHTKARRTKQSRGRLFTPQRFQVRIAQQELNLSEIFPGFQKVSGPTVPQAVRRYGLGDTGPLRGVSNDVVDRFRTARPVDAPIVIHAWEQIGFGFIQRQYSRRVSNSFGVIGTSRSRLPLP
jgi:hypothetical protein